LMLKQRNSSLRRLHGQLTFTYKKKLRTFL
jgi:hypothetical protein